LRGNAKAPHKHELGFHNNLATTPQKMNLKPIAIILVIAIALNLMLFTFGVINQFWFWITIIVIGFIAYKVMPKLK